MDNKYYQTREYINKRIEAQQAVIDKIEEKIKKLKAAEIQSLEEVEQKMVLESNVALPTPTNRPKAPPNQYISSQFQTPPPNRNRTQLYSHSHSPNNLDINRQYAVGASASATPTAVLKKKNNLDNYEFLNSKSLLNIINSQRSANGGFVLNSAQRGG
eukprot:181586_1